jgi:tetratricopeptide (TPR) repeat protein
MPWQNKGQLEWFETGILDSIFRINNRALTFWAIDLPEKAIATLSQGILLFPRSKRLFGARTGLLIKMRRFKQAIETATKALELDDGYEKMLNYRGYALMELEQFELALVDINKALRIKPNDIHNLMNRSFCLTALHNLEEAKRDNEQVERLKQLQGKHWNSDYEVRARTDEDDGDFSVTGKNKDHAVRLLYKLNMVKQLHEDMTALAEKEDVVEFVRFDAEEIVSLLDYFEENQQLKEGLFFHSDLTIEDAIELVKESSRASTPLEANPRAAEAAEILRRVVVMDSLSLKARGGATQALALHLPVDEIEKLVVQITDLSENGTPEAGVAVATELIKSIGNRSGIAALERLAKERNNRGWIRELACEVMGTYLDARRAIALLNGLEAERRHGAGLTRAIARAREHFQLNIAGEREKDPAELLFEETFDAVLRAGPVENVAAMHSRYPLITDPALLRHLEEYLRQLPAGPEKALLEKKVQQIKGIPKPIFQDAFNAFGEARSLEEMKAVAEKHPSLTTLNAQEELKMAIERDVPKANKALFLTKLEWLRSIKPDLVQLAVEAFADADSLEDLKRLAVSHPVLKTRKFKQIAEHLIVNGTPDPPMDVRRRWLEELDGDPADKLFDEAWNDLREGRYKDALQKTQRFEKMDPKRSTSMLKGLAYAHLGEHEKAIRELSLELERNKDGVLYAVRGKAFFMTGEMNKAIADFSHAIELEPGNFEAWYGRANAYSRLNNWVKMKEDMERALEIKPQDAGAAFMLAVAYVQTGQKKAALHVLDTFPDWSGELRPQVESLRRAIGKTIEDPVEETFYALSQTTNGNEVYALTEDRPELKDPKFIKALKDRIGQMPEGSHRNGMLERFTTLLSIVDNPAQKAFDRLLDVKDIADVSLLLQEHPIAKREEFAADIRQMLTKMGNDPIAGEIRRKLEMLEEAKRK